jgi:hypothetical protein
MIMLLFLLPILFLDGPDGKKFMKEDPFQKNIAERGQKTSRTTAAEPHQQPIKNHQPARIR